MTRALEKYAQGPVTGLWKRPGSGGDHSIVWAATPPPMAPLAISSGSVSRYLGDTHVELASRPNSFGEFVGEIEFLGTDESESGTLFLVGTRVSSYAPLISAPIGLVWVRALLIRFADFLVDNYLMGFLDNLESDLKNLEKQEDRNPKEQKRRNAERTSVLAVAPWAEKLKKSPYTQDVLAEAARISHQIRSRIQVAWLDTGLKLEFKERRLELRPTANGIVAVFVRNGKEEKVAPADLNANGSELVRDWLKDVLKKPE